MIGKPSQDLLKTILATYNLNPARTCMVREDIVRLYIFATTRANSVVLVMHDNRSEIAYRRILRSAASVASRLCSCSQA